MISNILKRHVLGLKYQVFRRSIKDLIWCFSKDDVYQKTVQKVLLRYFLALKLHKLSSFIIYFWNMCPIFISYPWILLGIGGKVLNDPVQ